MDEAPSPSPGSAPHVHAAGEPGGMTVWTLSGDWRAAALPDWPPRSAAAGLRLRAEALQGWDARLAARLWGLLRSASSGMEVQLDDSLPEGLRAVIAQAGATAAPAPAAAPAPKPAVWWRGLERLGRRVLDGHGQFAVSLGFFGQTLLALARVPRGGSGLRWRDLVWQVEQTGPRSTLGVAALPTTARRSSLSKPSS